MMYELVTIIPLVDPWNRNADEFSKTSKVRCWASVRQNMRFVRLLCWNNQSYLRKSWYLFVVWLHGLFILIITSRGLTNRAVNEQTSLWSWAHAAIQHRHNLQTVTERLAHYPLYLWGPVIKIFPTTLLLQAEEMAERGRHPESGDVYRDYKSRDRVYPRNGDHAPQDSRGLNQKPRDMDMRGSAGNKRAKHSSQRDMASASDVHPPGYRNQNHEGPPKQ